jgi:hypothetical protein
MPESSILDTAIAAHNAGLCPIRAKTDGSKAPLRPWKERQSERPDMADVMTEFAHSENIGLVMGAISDRLVCLEMEGRFMEDFDAAIERLKAADLGGVLENWINGYSEKSPGGGIHILVHVGGDGPVPGNIKVASDSLHQTLIETRGEGGFLIVAPSNGSTHPSGGKWEMIRGSFDEIAWATPEEFAGVLGVLASFNVERASGVRDVPPAYPQRTFEGESRFDQYLATLPSVADYLASIGWEPCGQDAEGIHMRRPGKTDPGKSGSINHNGRLYVFSSSTPLTPSEQLGHRTYDVLDIMLAYDYGRNPTADERTERFRQWRGGQSSPRTVASSQVSGGDTGGQSSSPDLWLPPEFWTQRPVLQAIHDASLARMRSPEGVLGAFLSSYATTVPMSIKLPDIVGVPSPLNMYCALVARSGGGKSTSMRLALDLLGWNANNNPNVLLDRSLRSGEGLITLAQMPKTKDNPEPGYRNAVQVCFDEGGTLAAQAARSGSTTIPYLNTAWAGLSIVGGAKASESGSFPSDLVRICAVIGVQFGVCADLFTGEVARLGFPQRILFFGLENPVLATVDPTVRRPTELKPIDVQFWNHGEFAHNSRHIGVPDDVWVEVMRWDQRNSLGLIHERLDGHQMLIQLRTAALFALMDDRASITNEDWLIADAICATSRRIRSQLVQSIGDASKARAQQRGVEDAVRAEAADTAWLDGKARRLAGKLKGEIEGLTRKELRAKLSGTERPRINEILQHAVACRLMIHRDDRYFGGGE